MEKNKKKTRRYKGKSFRLNNKTFFLLKKLKIKYGRSWNLFFYELANFYIKNKNKNEDR